MVRGRRIPQRGDIWHIDLDPALGSEQRGSRPALILSPAPFNRLGLFLACPITQGGEFARTHGFTVSLSGTGTTTQGVILVHQARMLDYRERNARFVEHAPDEITEDVLARVAALLE
ncbi:type II toxin-antitoxin system ChpB family toxin [Acidithiobacillus sulfuriphilus]|uniref:Type II toxin-antitoxin system ChpB family toxin n=1 Tax=Acidithiobacillus sulfuriphilus TaxID=1867749 RepID=A0ACD5HQ78_9PROT|nr:type II toxin-antitoxin system ChpB family toxin [Acidithiobacillus sulfuriphilus]